MPRSRYLFPALTLSLALAATGCSKPAPEPTPPPPSTSTSAPAPSRPAVDVSTLDAPLAVLATAIYTGKAPRATEPVKAALADTTVPTSPVKVTAGIGKWNGEKIAVLVSGKDATLAVEQGGKWKAVGGWWPGLGVPDTVLGPRRHVVLLGSDAREAKGEKVEAARADAIQVIGVDGKGGGGIMGVPRDIWTDIGGGQLSKINAALALHGPEAQQQAVANATSLDVEGYVLTGFTGFQDMIDELGGITIDATMPVRKVPKGEVKVDGYDAFWFSRERKTLPNGDFDRSFNQGTVLAGIGAKAMLDGPAGLPGILQIADKHVQTNLDAEAALTLAAWALRIDPKKVGHQVAPADYGTSADGQSILVPNQLTRALFADFADGNIVPAKK